MKNIAAAPKKSRPTLFLAAVHLVCLMSLTSCFTQEQSASTAGAATETSSTAPVKWDASSLVNGMDVKISQDIINSFDNNDLDSNNYNPVEQMFAQWNGATSAETFFRIPATATENRDHAELTTYRDSEMGIYKSYSWFSNVQETVLAVTQYYGYRRNSGTASEYIQITHADIILNEFNYDFSTDASSLVTYDIHSVILHELGHFLGLAHTSSFSTNSVMQPSLAISGSKRTITSYDAESIVELYGGSSSSALMAQTEALSVSASSSSAVSSSSTQKKTLPSAARQISDDGEVHGLIELRADGICQHRINGQIVSKHEVDLHKRLK